LTCQILAIFYTELKRIEPEFEKESKKVQNNELQEKWEAKLKKALQADKEKAEETDALNAIDAVREDVEEYKYIKQGFRKLKQKLTLKQIEAILWVKQLGYSQATAGKMMKRSRSEITRLLLRAEKECPELSSEPSHIKNRYTCCPSEKKGQRLRKRYNQKRGK